MEMETRKGARLTVALAIIAGVAAMLLVAAIVLSLPYFEKNDARLETEPTPPPTEETEPPTEPEPTLPPPEENPYGKLDFQYDGRYLKLIEGKSTVGIDVSAYQKEVDWEQVKASGVEFAMIRVAYRGYESGAIVEDRYARANLEGATAAGLKVGVYFFSQALTVEEAKEEARHVLGIISGYDVTMPVVFDWEDVHQETARTNNMDKQTLTDCAKAFMETVKAGGHWPMVYFNTHQSIYDLDIAQLKEYDFWLALYSDRMRFPYKIKMWQYSCTGRVPGIEGDVDLNVFFDET